MNQELNIEELRETMSKYGKSHVARILIGQGCDNKEITAVTAIDRATLSRLRKANSVAPSIVRTRKPKTEEVPHNNNQPPAAPLMFQQNISINQPAAAEPNSVDGKSMNQIVLICCIMLSVPLLIGVAYANIYYELISTITPNHFSALISTLALEVSPFVIFISNNAIGRIMNNNLTNVFRGILWVLCVVDVVGISYSLIQSGSGATIGISYALILTVLHTGIISLTNEVLIKWTEGK